MRVVLLFARAPVVTRGSFFAEHGRRLRALPRQSDLVGRTRLSRKPVPFLGEKSDLYLLVSAGLFFFLAYRFDNRFVLSLALSSLAGWFGLSISHWTRHADEVYRLYAIAYSALIGGAGVILKHRGVKAHFLGTYLNIAANVVFWAVLSGVFLREDTPSWLLALLVVCAASLAWGLHRREFSFVAYAAVYGYVGISSILLRNMNDVTAIFAYFVVTGTAMLVMLVMIGRRFGREQ